MAYEINITGEIIPFPIWEGWTGVTNLEEIEKQLTAAAGEDLIVNINSIGGDVDEGFMIYTAIRKYAKDHGAHVTTYAKGRCYSIATVIFLAGDTRIANRYIAPFIHNAWVFTEGDAKQLIKMAADLQKVNDRIATHYAEHTDLTKDEALQLMDDDTFITPEECVRIRFATEIEEVLRPAALLRVLNTEKTTIKNKSNMNNTKKKDLLDKLMSIFNAKNLVVFTSTSEELTFPDLEDGDEPKVGDKATIDGKAAEGRITVQDGRTFVFVAGVLEEIEDAEEGDETEDATEELARLRAENEKLKSQISAQAKEITEVSNKVNKFESTFNALKAALPNAVVKEDNPDKTKDADEGDGGDNIAAAWLNKRKANKVK